MSDLATDYLARYRARRAAEQAAKVLRGEVITPKPKVIPAADIADVLHEQLDALIAHATGFCGCSDCRRYLDVRAILMQPFEETATKAMSVGA